MVTLTSWHSQVIICFGHVTLHYHAHMCHRLDVCVRVCVRLCVKRAFESRYPPFPTAR